MSLSYYVYRSVNRIWQLGQGVHVLIPVSAPRAGLSTSQNHDVRSILSVFLAVKYCVNVVLGYVRRHGKSPCFLRCGFSIAVDVEGQGVDFNVVDGVVFHD